MTTKITPLASIVTISKAPNGTVARPTMGATYINTAMYFGKGLSVGLVGMGQASRLISHPTSDGGWRVQKRRDPWRVGRLSIWSRATITQVIFDVEEEMSWW